MACAVLDSSRQPAPVLPLLCTACSHPAAADLRCLQPACCGLRRHSDLAMPPTGAKPHCAMRMAGAMWDVSLRGGKEQEGELVVALE